MWGKSFPAVREGGTSHLHPLAYPLHMACMKKGGAELVNALVHAGAQLECRKVWSSTTWSSRWEGTSLFRAACFPRYDSVQKLVWQGASLKAPTACTVWGMQQRWESRAQPPPQDDELAAMLHPSTYKWVHVILPLFLCIVLSTLCSYNMSPCIGCRLLQDLDDPWAQGKVLEPRPLNLQFPKVRSFKSAAKAGLERRRLLVLAVLSVCPGPHLPAEVLQHICKQAELAL